MAHVDARIVALRQARFAELALAIGAFAIGTGEFAAMGFLPSVADGLGVTIPEAGRSISAYALGVVVGAPLIAVLGAKLSRRALLLVLMSAVRGRESRERARAELRFPARPALRERPAARRLFRRRRAGRGRDGGAGGTGARGRAGDARPHRRDACRHAGRHLGGAGARLADGLRLRGHARPRHLRTR